MTWMITDLLLIVHLTLFTYCESYSFVNPISSRQHHQNHQHQNHHQHQNRARRSCMEMKTKVAILGLPNVGKSTLFNALAQKSIAHAANFPFCTIEPNIAPIPVPSQHLAKLGTFANSRRSLPATMEWVDVAGLVKGASRGEGLGNRFLATVRECDAICHLLRCYEDPDVIHVDGKVDPVADAEVVNLELVLADLAHVGRRLAKSTCKGEERDVLEKVENGLEKGIPARAIGLSDDEQFSIKSMGLLTLKPVLYALNIDEVDFMFDKEALFTQLRDKLKGIQYSDPNTQEYAVVSAKFEAEMTEKSKLEQLDYVSSLGLELEDGEDLDDLLCCNVLPLLIQKLLNISLVYTGPGVSPERSRTTKAYLFRHGKLDALGLAGRLHGEIERGFICAEVASAEVLLQHEGFTAAKESGDIRTEGKNYVVQSGDVVLIKWN
jgi:GTP-binding protein YchF